MHRIAKSIIVARTSVFGYSSLSQVSADAICTTLGKFYQGVKVISVSSVADLELIVHLQPDVVFSGFIKIPDDTASVEGSFIMLSDYLESHGICHTGSESAAMDYSLHKPHAKQRVMLAGLKTATFVHNSDVALISATFDSKAYPLFVKPASLGGGEGIDESSVVHTKAQLTLQILKLKAKGVVDVLIESYLPGKEYSVAVLRKLNTDQYLSMPIELIALPDIHGDRMLSLAVKHSNEEVISIISNAVTNNTIKDFAVAVFKALGARDYGRIDIRCDANGTPHFLEANLIPSLIEHYGSFPKASWLNENMSHETMLLTIVNLALERVELPAPDPLAPFVS